MTRSARAFTEAFDRARTVPVPVTALDPAELADQAASPKRSRPWRQWLGVAAAITLVGGVLYGVAQFSGRGIAAVPASAPVASLEGIVGRTWNAIEIGGVPVSDKGKGVPSLSFTKDSRFSGADPCNGLGGSYRIDGKHLRLQRSGLSTLIGCEVEQQQRFVDGIDATRTASLSNDVLTLRDEKGAVAMVLHQDRAVDASVSPSTGQTIMVSPSAVANPIARSRELPDAPASVTERAGRFDCGDIELGQAEQPPATAIACLTAHRGITDAELAVSQLTDEGEPIVTFYLVKAEGETIEVHTTNHWDTYSQRDWLRGSCKLSAGGSWETLRVCS